MARDEHKKLAATIKKIHSDLRTLSAEFGAEQAWKQHLKNESTLKIYAQSMKQLAENHWIRNEAEDDRINWIVNFCETYFYGDELEKWKLKELRTIEALKKLGVEIEAMEEAATIVGGKLETLDVGSSGNFFRNYSQFNMLPIDISPSNESVAYCDFLSVPVGERLQRTAATVEALPANNFDAVIFSLLLEYLPTSEQRIKCCENAYQVLKPQGVLIIVTPDSNHETKNSQLIKNWRWTLAKLGFTRVKVEKLKNLTCMAFRKSLPSIANHWADTHQEAWMKFKIEIPQDKSCS